MRDLYAHYALSVTFGDRLPQRGSQDRGGSVSCLSLWERWLRPTGADGEGAERVHTKKSICSEHCRCFSFCLFAYFFKYSSHPEEVTTCWSVVHQRASTPSRLSTIFWPSSSGIQNRPVVRQSARPESLHSTVTLLK